MHIEKLINQIDWDKLRTFYYVARLKSFTKAGEHLHLNQSTLSRALQALERQMGHMLIQRDSRNLVLTQEGEILFNATRKIFSELENALNLIDETDQELQGPIRIRASSGMANHFLIKYIPSFIEKFPKVRITLIASDSPPALDLFEADVAIRPLMPPREDLIQRILLVNHVGLYASPAYLEKFGVPLEAKDLDNHRLISFGQHEEAYPFHNMNWHLSLGCKPGHVREPFICANTPSARLDLAKAGLGIIAISKEHPDLASYGLVQVLENIPGPTVESYFIYSSLNEGSRRIKALEEHLIEAFTRDYGS